MGKIQTTLELIRRKLDEYLRNADGSSRQWVILSNVVNHDGALYEEAKDKVVMFLANIQNDNTVSSYRPAQPVGDNRYSVVAPPLYVDLYILFFANFYDRNYPEGLGMISRVISFFQQNLYFTHETLPALDPTIDKLTFELMNLDATALNYLMGLAGTKYLPSAYYKVRTIPFISDAMQAQVPAVQGVQAPGQVDE